MSLNAGILTTLFHQFGSIGESQHVVPHFRLMLSDIGTETLSMKYNIRLKRNLPQVLAFLAIR